MKNRLSTKNSLFRTTLLLVFLAGAAQAQVVWNGGSTSSSDWSDSANWVGGVPPASATTTAIRFAGNTRLGPIVDTPVTVKTIEFYTGAGAFNLTGSEISIQGAGTVDSDGVINNTTSAITINNDLKLLGGVAFNASKGDMTLKNISLNNNSVRFRAAAGKTVYLNGVISGSGGSGSILDFYGAGNYVISGNNSFSVTSTRIISGNVLLQSDKALGSDASAVTLGVSWFSGSTSLLTDGSITFGRAVALTYNATNTYTVGGNSANNSSFSNTVTVANSANAVTLNLTAASGGRVNFAGNVQDSSTGAGSIAKKGAGIVVLGGSNNNYKGTTAVTEGTLLVNGVLTSLASDSAVTVGPNATLGGNGIIQRSVVINGDGIISAGDMDITGQSLVGTLQLKNGLTLADSSLLEFDLGASSDLLAVTGNLVLDGLLSVKAGTGFGAGTYTLFTYTGTLTDMDLQLSDLPAGYTYSLDLSNGGLVNLNVVPEPTTTALILGSLCLALFLRVRSGRDGDYHSMREKRI